MGLQGKGQPRVHSGDPCQSNDSECTIACLRPGSTLLAKGV
jgi:hypothetical protein